MYKYIQASLATQFQAEGRSDIKRLNCSNVVAFFVYYFILFYKLCQEWQEFPTELTYMYTCIHANTCEHRDGLLIHEFNLIFIYRNKDLLLIGNYTSFIKIKTPYIYNKPCEHRALNSMSQYNEYMIYNYKSLF